jgi:hypothetical protein
MEYVNGLWQEAAINKPRRYNDAYLNEPFARNQLTHNTTFTGWTQVLQSFSTGVQSPISGVLSKRLLVTGAGSNYLLQSLSATGTRTITASLMVKNVDYVGSEIISMNVSDGVVGGMTAYYRPSNDTITFAAALSWSNVAVKKTAESEGFTRIEITGTVTSAAAGWFEITGVNGRSIDITAPQIETGSVATSPIITQGAAKDRLADVPSKTNCADIIGQTEGTIFLDSYFDATDLFNFYLTNGGTANSIGIESDSGARITATITNGGVIQVNMPNPTALTKGNRYKVAICYALNNTRFYINGVLVGTDTSCTIPTCNQLMFSRANGTGIANQRVNELKLLKTAISNAEAIALTTL